jgi:hypothetical protein
VKSAEQAAKRLYDGLPTRKKMRVMDWLVLGNSWSDSLINSGVLADSDQSAYPRTPSEAARDELADQLNEKRLARQLRNLLPDEVSSRRQTAEHEAAHAVCVLAFGKALRSISIDNDNPSGGLCSYERGLTPLETAVVCVAPIVWLEQIRYRSFPHYLANGATGCESDIRKAQDAVGCDMNFELGRAFRNARELLLAEYDSVMAIGDRLDRDGEYRPYPTSPTRVKAYGAS